MFHECKNKNRMFNNCYSFKNIFQASKRFSSKMILNDTEKRLILGLIINEMDNILIINDKELLTSKQIKYYNELKSLKEYFDSNLK
jgi:hypothetical protein